MNRFFTHLLYQHHIKDPKKYKYMLLFKIHTSSEDLLLISTQLYFFLPSLQNILFIQPGNWTKIAILQIIINSHITAPSLFKHVSLQQSGNMILMLRGKQRGLSTIISYKHSQDYSCDTLSEQKSLISMIRCL